MNYQSTKVPLVYKYNYYFLFKLRTSCSVYYPSYSVRQFRGLIYSINLSKVLSYSENHPIELLLTVYPSRVLINSVTQSGFSGVS